MEASLDEPPSLDGILTFISLVTGDTPSLYYFIFVGIILVALLVISALISGSEVAFFSISGADYEECRSKTGLAYRRIIKLLDEPKYLLAYILILNNFVNVAFVTLSTVVSWQLFSQSREASIIFILTATITVVLVFVGEIVPKIYAAQQSLAFAKMTSRFIWVGGKIVQPLAWVLVSLTNIVERRIEKRGYTSSIDEVNQALEMTTSSDISDQEKGILKGIVNFSTISVTQIMRARVDIEGIDIEMHYHELMDRVNKLGFSRMPVYRENLDNIEGILYVKDLLPFIQEEEDFNWQKLLRPAFFIPESKKIDDLLEDFQEKRVHIAIVVDEYGGTEGLITMEDILEEIVGDISDEYDEDESIYQKLDDKTYSFEAKTSVFDFCKAMHEDPRLFDEERGESESIGGMILEVNGALPNTGESLTLHGYTFTVTSVDSKKIKKVKIRRNK